jgi:hypothetical protein
MNRKFVVLMVAALMLMMATGCSKKAARIAPTSLVEVFAGSPQRYIAERHKLEIIAPESNLQKS